MEVQVIREDDLFEAYLHVDQLHLRFPRSWLQPAVLDEAGRYVPDPVASHFVESRFLSDCASLMK